ncbi:cobalt ABC transporter permease [Burkholderia stagnalis]|uniref:DUF2523 domain-containing protein n=1 Tax=Burkholderia cepacia complex TaxID=87882 RepID=UPI0005042174|nr:MULTISPECIES: DUF2523 domain-containing protein [Burkholderia cepacia complex]KFL55744.1 cobalt ABC transporter permease [Burkholderia pyrrocinia]KVD90818.1 cobalt ABC transporter permease [Burkholderia stagnalis]KVH69301.1 cobalt ABC transporter permease [Burkholderia ubonensis]KVU01575.1 cobalt ABC transporter permease [Burkholderia ubonensis]KVU20182.1 cobalt ABC transporter permease [Burkholderia ubonensis]
MTWATWLLGLVQPLIVQALIALGVGVLTVGGIDLAMNTALSWLTSAVGGLPADMANILAMGGVFQGMGYIGGGITARVTMAGISGAKKFFIK